MLAKTYCLRFYFFHKNCDLCIACSSDFVLPSVSVGVGIGETLALKLKSYKRSTKHNHHSVIPTLYFTHELLERNLYYYIIILRKLTKNILF